jgi:hypothetical protein
MGWSTNHLRDMGETVGEMISTSSRAKERIHQRTIERLQEALQSGNYIRDIEAKNADEFNVLVSSLIETLDSPELDLSENARVTLKSRLHNAFQESGQKVSENMTQMVSETVRQLMDTSTPAGRLAFVEARKRARGLMGQIAPITAVPAPATRLFTPFTGNVGEVYGPEVSGRIRRLRELTGVAPELLQEADITGEGLLGLHARVRVRGNQFVSVPVHAQRIGEAPVTRIGTSTAYSFDRFYGDLEAAANSAGSQMGDIYDAAFLELRRMSSATGGVEHVDPRLFRQNLRQLGAVLPRGAQAALTAGGAMRAQLQRNVSLKHAGTTLMAREGLSSAEIHRLRAFAAAHVPGFDPGADAAITRLPHGGAFVKLGNVGLNPLSLMRNTGFVNRTSVPVTARPEQFVGRETLFLEPEIGPLFSGSILSGAEPIEWSQDIGGINRAVIIDYLRGGSRWGLGKGLGEAIITGQNIEMAEVIEKKIFDPTMMKTSPTKMLNALLSAPNQRVSLSGKEARRFMREYGRVLGVSGNGVVKLPNRRDVTGLELGVVRRAEEESGSTFYEITGTLRRRIRRSEKIFSPVGKALAHVQTEEQVAELILRGMGMNVQALGVNPAALLLTGPDTVTKSAQFLVQQTVAGTARGTTGPVNVKDFFASMGSAIATRMGGVSGLMPDVVRARYMTSAGLEALARLENPVLAAQTVAHVWWGGAGMLGAGLGRNLRREITAGARTKWGGPQNSTYRQFFRTLGRGFGVGASTLSPGAAPWGVIRASMEPQMRNMFRASLMGMGLEAREANRIVGGFAARIPGMARKLSALRSLQGMMGVISGNRSPVDLELSGRLPRVLWQEFIRPTDSMNARRLLAQYEEGFLLDLAGENTVLSRIVRDVFGGTVLHVPGGRFLRDTVGINIKGAGGTTTHVLPEYVRRMHDLMQILTRISSMSVVNAENVGHMTRTLRGWKEGMAGLLGEVHASVFRGKMAGTGFLVGRSMRVATTGATAGLGLDLVSEAGLGRVGEVLTRTQGSALFMDAGGFIDIMKSYTKGAYESALAEGTRPPAATTLARLGLAQNLQRFFTGMETGKGAGVVALSGRYPALTPGNIGPVQVFRHPGETQAFGTADEVFREVRRVPAMASTLGRMEALAGAPIAGFGDIARLAGREGAGLRRSFFRQMARNISQFTGSAGEGHLWFPSMPVDVHYGGGKYSVDLSNVANMLGDFDKDTYMLLFPNTGRKSAARALAGRDALTNAAVSRIRQAFSYSAFLQETKRGMERQRAEALAAGISPNVIGEIEQGALKEQFAKEVGPINIALGKLRLGTMSFGGEDEVAGRHLLDLLGAVEEATTIKAKKQPIAFDYARQISDVVENAINTRDIAGLRNLFNDLLFKESPLLRGIRVERAEVAGYLKEAGVTLPENIFRALEGHELGLEPIYEMLQRVVNITAERNAAYSTTAAGIASIVERSNVSSRQAYDYVFRQRGSPEVAAALAEIPQDVGERLSEVVSSRLGQIKAATSRFDRRLITPIALGALGTMALGSLLGREGYSPDAMIMPGEVVSPRVTKAIHNGTLFSQESVGPTPEDVQRQDEVAGLMQRPLVPGESYFARRNAFQIRGEVKNFSGMTPITQFLNGVGGSASVRINDTRRPITTAYTERLMGD